MTPSQFQGLCLSNRIKPLRRLRAPKLNSRLFKRRIPSRCEKCQKKRKLRVCRQRQCDQLYWPMPSVQGDLLSDHILVSGCSQRETEPWLSIPWFRIIHGELVERKDCMCRPDCLWCQRWLSWVDCQSSGVRKEEGKRRGRRHRKAPLAEACGTRRKQD